jgi:sec-independent protein translocase protein TatB
MYLFILESIGTQELIIIGLAALIFLGPRKLPELARSLGRAMNEFRRSTNDFKQTWEREVVTEVNKLNTETDVNSFLEVSKPMDSSEKNTIAPPEIKEVSEVNFEDIISRENLEAQKKTEEALTAGKQSWL